MSEQTNQTPENENPAQAGAAQPAAPAKKSNRRKWLIGGGAVVLAFGALIATKGVMADRGFTRAGWSGHHGHGMHRNFDPAKMGKKIDFGVDLILGRVGADDGQKTKVAGTIKGVLGQVPEFRKGHMEAHKQLFTLLKADKFDKDALEKLRVERIKALDEASKKVAAALGEVATTLTDKQRKELVEFAEKRRRMFGRH